MPSRSPFETHVVEYEAWFKAHKYVFESEMLAIKPQLEQLPENLHGIEVGLGTGIYAKELGILEGVEPADAMREIAIGRGLDVMNATAEHLPYRDMHFDFVLFVTICYLDNLYNAFREAYRVLRNKGSVIVAFIDQLRPVATQYEKKRHKSHFYKQARYYTVDYVLDGLKNARFKNPAILQTLFSDIENMTHVEEPLEGYGEGSFVVIRARK